MDSIYDIARFMAFKNGCVLFRKLVKGENAPLILRLPLDCPFLQGVMGDDFLYEDYLEWEIENDKLEMEKAAEFHEMINNHNTYDDGF